MNHRSSTCVGNTNVALLDEGAIDHVDDAVGADHIRAEDVNLLVVPNYRVTCKTERERLDGEFVMEAIKVSETPPNDLLMAIQLVINFISRLRAEEPFEVDRANLGLSLHYSRSIA